MRLIVIAALVCAGVVGCGDDSGGTDAGTDAARSDGGGTDGGMVDSGGTDSGMDAATSDGGGDSGPADGGVDPIERGRYLANHVWTCNDCHTPRDATGAFVAGMRLAGQDISIPGLDLHIPNLTPDMDTGLGGWTDDQIRTAITMGIDRDGNNMHPIMPYWMMHLLTDEDVGAIIAYLRSIPAVSNAITEMPPFPELAVNVNDSDIPMPTLDSADPLYATALRGRYLATPCMECHTPQQMVAGAPPLDPSLAFSGGRMFPLPDPGGGPPIVVYSPNITQGVNGTDLDTIALIQGALTTSTEICPPMPIGPDGYWGLTDEDAEAIATYIFYLPPMDTAAPTPACPLTAM